MSVFLSPTDVSIHSQAYVYIFASVHDYQPTNYDYIFANVVWYWQNLLSQHCHRRVINLANCQPTATLQNRRPTVALFNVAGSNSWQTIFRKNCSVKIRGGKNIKSKSKCQKRRVFETLKMLRLSKISGQKNHTVKPKARGRPKWEINKRHAIEFSDGRLVAKVWPGV